MYDSSKYLWSQYEKAIATVISQNFNNPTNLHDLSNLNPLSLALLLSLTNGDVAKLFQNNSIPNSSNGFQSHNHSTPIHNSFYLNNQLRPIDATQQQPNLGLVQQIESQPQVNSNSELQLPSPPHPQICDTNHSSSNLNPISHFNDNTPQLPSLPSSFKAQPPSVPSSTLLAKLSSVTARQNSSNVIATKLDHRMIDLLESFYSINDNPEPAAIEMIAKRINTSVDIISDWFDQKRLKLNPQAGPRSPPAKKRAGGRVVTFSEYQRSLLEAIFDENNYLHPQEYEELSNLIQVPSRNIKIWFKNRRSKQRLSGRVSG